MKVKLDPGAYLPERAHPEDAGLDIRAIEAGKVLPGEGVVFRTGVHVEIPDGCCGLLVSKSGLNVAHGVTSTGLIDQGYTGEILVKLYNHGPLPYAVSEKQKISQLVILPCMHPYIEIVDELSAVSGRGDAGFGSSGK